MKKKALPPQLTDPKDPVATRCALLSAESRAGQYKYSDIQNAVAHLHGMLEGAHIKR